MKKIICEICENSVFTKENGKFICNECGTQYTTEEIKKLMIDVDGNDTTNESLHTNISIEDRLSGLFDKINTYMDVNDYPSAETYCSQAIELDNKSSMAWFLKAKSVLSQSTLKHLRISESANYFFKAIDYAMAEEKEKLLENASNEIIRATAACFLTHEKFVSDLFKDYMMDDIKDVHSEFMSATKTLSKAMTFPTIQIPILLDQIERVALAGLNGAYKRWKDLDSIPSEFRTRYARYLCLESIENTIKTYTILFSIIDELYPEYKENSENYIKALGYMVNAIELSISLYYYDSYPFSKSNAKSCIAPNEKQERKNRIKELNTKIKQINNAKKEKEKSIKEQQLKDYWEQHKEEKEILEAEKIELEHKQEINTVFISKLAELKKNLENIITDDTNYTSELKMQKKYLDDLRVEKSQLSPYDYDRKNQIDSEIFYVESLVSSLKQQAQEESTMLNRKVVEDIKYIDNKINTIQKSNEGISRKLSSIKNKLTTVPKI